MFCKKYYLLIIFLKLVSSLRLHTSSRLSGFVLVNNNFTYIEELVPSQIDIAAIPNGSNGGERHQDPYNPNEKDVVNPTKANVRFEPSVLYFKDKIVGNSYRETVFIFNTSQNKTLRMEKIAGSKHSQIQIASFGDELVTPGGNTTFDIVFIGKDLVPLSTYYYIYTSRGILKYDVVAWCVENPYGITPMSLITLPLNSSYSHSITLRNPLPEPLQITEALLHGGDYTSHTLPPNIDFDNAVESWTIQPYETKEILRVHFLTYEAWNLTTFQSIKLGTGTTLLIPVEVEVVPRTGLYVPGHKIDFESGGHLDPPAVRPVHLCSSAKKTVTIENISCESRIDGCEILDFRPTALPPWSCAINPIAKIKFFWSSKLPGEITSGGLLIKNDLDPFFRINYTARVQHGGLTYNSSLTHYVTGISSFSGSPRPFAFKNEYRELVAVMNVYLSFEAAEYFHIRGFEPLVLKPQEKKVLFNLQTRKGVKLAELKLDSSILLETNISTIRLPLRVYDGLLTKLSKVAPSALHLGLVSAKSTVLTYFGLANTNPETIFVKYFGCNDSSFRIDLLDVKPGNARTFYYRSFTNSESGMLNAGGFNIRPHHYASFKLSVNTSDSEEEVYAEVWVQTEFQRLIFPVYMNVAKGYLRVSPDPFEFEDCFPGAYCVQQLTIESHFMRSMSIINISTIPYTSYDKLLFYPNMPAVITGHSTSIVGNILWEPTIDLSQSWPLGYLGLPNNRTGRDRWLGTIERPNITRDFDLTLMESQYLRYREQYSSPIDLTFRMDTTEMRNFLFKGRIQLQWPQIVTSRVIDFPLVQIGTVSYENVSVFNPMHSHYMTVQAIMAHHYQQEVPTVVSNIVSEYEEPGGVESKSNEFFLDMSIVSPYRFSVLNGTKRKFTNHRSSIVFVLPPQANATVRIGFMPSSQIVTTTRLYLRNDFTILDSVAINGAGAYPQLTLEGLENSAGNLIKFVIPHETLKLCDESSNRVLNITTKKVFRLRNTGQVSIHIFGFTINGLPCQGYGFKITNCHHTPFLLKPGMSKRVEISFTPDFTSARIESNLLVESDIKMGPMLSYTLYAALDSDWLRKCKPHLQRPYWEPLVYYLMIGMFFFLLIGVAIMAVYEVSTQTSRLIIGFGGIEQKVQPLYDLKVIELFFMKSSVPHNHHHHHHHQNHNHHHHRSSATTTSQSKSSELVLSSVSAIAAKMPLLSPSVSSSKDGEQRSSSIPNEHIEFVREPVLCASAIPSNNVGGKDSEEVVVNTSTPFLGTSPMAVTVSSTSNAKIVYSTPSSSSRSYVFSADSVKISSSISSGSDSVKNACIVADSSSDSSRSGNVSGSSEKREKCSEIVAAQTTPSTIRRKQNENISPVESGGLTNDSSICGKSKKGKKYDFEEVCYKSNWFKKKQAKKEEKLSGNKFLKSGWARCIKTSNLRTDTKCVEERRCNCLEKCTIQHANSPLTNETNSVTVSSVIPSRKEGSANDVFSANSSSHTNNNTNNNNSKLNNKDLPRKLDFNKFPGKKISSSCTDFVLQTSVATDIATDIVPKNAVSCTYLTVKSNKQKKKKRTVETVNKFNETTTKENIKENCTSSKTIKKSTKDENISSSDLQIVDRKSEQLKSADAPTEALKPITNLPKSKEPFETLSSLCNDSVVLKSKRRSNVKKRAKDEKFVNLARELSIVFTTPEMIDRKSTSNKTTSSKIAFTEKGKKKAEHNLTTKSEKRKRNGLRMNERDRDRDRVNHQMNGTFNDVLRLRHSSVDEETRILNNSSGGNSTVFIGNCELYSRVVAPPASRSSSSSSSSGSTGSYESSGNMPSKMMNSQSNQNIFWDSWNNDTLFQTGVMQSNSSHISEVPEYNSNKHSTYQKIPAYITVGDGNQNFTSSNVFCNNSSFSCKQDEYDINSDETEDTEFYNFAKGSLTDEEKPMSSVVTEQPPSVTKPTMNDIWGPPTSLYTWTPSDLSGSPSNLTCDAVSAISLSRLLRFEEKKEKDIEQYRSLSSLWSTDMKSLWSHPKQE